eukprot:COSAG06_NODE_27555_length_592_cov_0.630081_1_plen_194_part_01
MTTQRALCPASHALFLSFSHPPLSITLSVTLTKKHRSTLTARYHSGQKEARHPSKTSTCGYLRVQHHTAPHRTVSSLLMNCRNSRRQRASSREAAGRSSSNSSSSSQSRVEDRDDLFVPTDLHRSRTPSRNQSCEASGWTAAPSDYRIPPLLDSHSRSHSHCRCRCCLGTVSGKGCLRGTVSALRGTASSWRRL